MPQYYVEGLFATKQGVKRKQKTGAYPSNSLEPYAKAIWANSPKEAIQLATEGLAGGEWVKAPRVGLVSEEQRMRSIGAPEFPGLTTTSPKKKKH